MSRRLAVVAAGGTGGHLFPAEALSQVLIDRGWRVVLATDARGAAYAEDFPAPSWILPGAHHADLVDPTTPYAAQVHLAWMEVYAGMFAAAQEGA